MVGRVYVLYGRVPVLARNLESCARSDRRPGGVRCTMDDGRIEVLIVRACWCCVKREGTPVDGCRVKLIGDRTLEDGPGIDRRQVDASGSTASSLPILNLP